MVLKMIKVQNDKPTREELPSFLQHLDPLNLLDLSWTDPAFGVQDAAWWPEVDQSPMLQEGQSYDGTEVLTVGDGLVYVVRGVRDLTKEEIRERWLVEHPVPVQCTRRQGLLALLSYGHRKADIEVLIAAVPDEIEREAALIEYEAATWERANPFLQAVWAQLGGTPEQLDDLFRLAVTL